MAPSGKPAPERAGDRDKALEAALVQIERQFGKGSVMRLGEQARVPVDVIPTGSIALDMAAFNVRSYPRQQGSCWPRRKHASYFFSIDKPFGPRSMRMPSGCLRS